MTPIKNLSILLFIYLVHYIEGLESSQSNNQIKDMKEEEIILVGHSGTDYNLRVLQSQTPHGFRIFGEYGDLNTQNMSLNVLKKIFSISSMFFQKLIKVTRVNSDDQTKYPVGTYSCGISVPEIYRSIGFNLSQTDSVIFISVESNSGNSYIAYSSGCVMSRWPLYSYIRFNTYFIDSNLTRTGIFHKNIYTTIHEIIHVLGMNSVYFNGLFFESYTSSVRLSQIQVITKKIVNGIQRKFLITQNVANYVMNYFGCTDYTIGALLEEEGGSTTVGAHWERKVFYDEIMTGSILTSGLRITKLTLNLLKDTGFYHSIDDTLADNAQFGKGDGCDFAMGLSSITPEYCTLTGARCDFYGFYGGTCINDSLSSGSKYIVPYSNLLCNVPQTTTLNGVFRQFTSKSRCFDGITGSGPNCYVAKCITGGIEVTVGTDIGICVPGQINITIGTNTFKCPPDQSVFCSRQTCDDWCGANGVCIQGQCWATTDCTPIHPQCSSCLNSYCLACKNGLFPSSTGNSCQTCGTVISNCAICWNFGGQTRCSSCQSTYYFGINQTTCSSCQNLITNCISCVNQNQTTKCNSCIPNSFINTNRDKCMGCSQLIQSCNQCSLNVTVVQCTVCNTGYTLSLDRIKCNINVVSTVIALGITNCLSQISNQCQECIPGLYPSISKLSCQTCQTIYPQCQTCSYLINQTQCLNCSTGYQLSADNLTCQVKVVCVSPCLTCNRSNTSSCLSCNVGYLNGTVCTTTCTQASGYYISGLSCLKCSNLCKTCMSSPTLCKSCLNGFYLTSDYYCSACDKTCATCSSALYCLKCTNSAKIPKRGVC